MFVPIQSLTPSPRHAALSALSSMLYSQTPNFYVRAPGRVNLIGEHVDHQGFGVLPMALEADVLIGVCFIDGDETVIQNIDGSRFTPKHMPIEEEAIRINPDDHHWSNYVLAGFKGVLQAFKVLKMRAMGMVVDGNVPIGSGLSSSSAMVCASALAMCYSLDLPMNQTELASLCASAEQYVGVAGGGMDQACSFLGQAEGALHITFDPLRSILVPLPETAAFVVAHSLVYSHKAQSNGYNCRVAECRIGAMLIMNGLGKEWRDIWRLRQVVEATEQDILKLAELYIPSHSITLSDAANLLDCRPQDIEIPKGLQNHKFYPLKRVQHVILEAKRVEEFAVTCDITKLGILMNESHYSMQQLFEASCPELDRLTDTCRSLGALGSRVTGAGWGGATVSLVHVNKVEQFVEDLAASDYYDGRDALIVLSKPAPGAAVVV